PPTMRAGVDVGGTFTDVILLGDGGGTEIRKLLSTPPEYDRAVVAALAERGRELELTEVVHGTTVATNAVLQRRGAVTALVTTRGFRDVLELRRLRIPHMYDLFWRKPEPLVPRRLRLEVAERVLADGTVERPLDEGEVRAVAARLRAAGVDSVAVCFLRAYLYPDHEERALAVLEEELPDATVSLSSRILREQREYERSATTVVNAYVRPLMASYIDRIRGGLDEAGIAAPLRIMQSSGGVMTGEDAKLRPVFALESGPAAGVIAARGIAARLGLRDAIVFDMGGTTAKASLIEDGTIARGREYEVGGSLSGGSRLIRGAGELLRVPTIDIAEVGAGGGSLAWLDPAGGLQVGPRSAGAEPGPACYGLGGVEPTVTDANVVLGYMPTGPIADGGISVAAGAALAAVEGIAGTLGLTAIAAADGIHRIANARMTRALRSVSSEKGRDPREFALIAFGGAGPVHAAGLAEDLGIATVVVPPAAGLFSAVGLLFARPEFHDVRSCHLDAATAGVDTVEALFAEMRAALAPAVAGDVEWQRSADLRYHGQSWEVEVPFPEGETLPALQARIEDEHERLYGVRGQPGAPVVIRAVRLAALGPTPQEQA
ncbi:MAG: hydantoinase/oxoprolinase family protein, partial [Actinobacteria bacterium]|nr:hydantoinase/oxoprolinase family protein [Actinomycetota bacterium]